MKEALTALAAGNLGLAHKLLSDAQAAAELVGDSAAVGGLLALRAQADIVESKFRSARVLLEQAFVALEGSGELGPATEALSLSSYVSSALGLNDQAVRQGFRAVKLAQQSGSPVAKVKAMNYLGVALFWAGHFDQAQGFFDIAIWEANEIESLELSYHPWVNKACGELTRQMCQRFALQGDPDPSVLHGHLASSMRIAYSTPATTLGAGTKDISLVLLEGVCSVASSWAADLQSAVAFSQACRQRAEGLPDSSWLHTIVLMAECELAHASGQGAVAADRAREMLSRAQRSEHLQMEWIGHKCLCVVLEAQHSPDAPAAREAAVRFESRFQVANPSAAEAAAGPVSEG